MRTLCMPHKTSLSLFPPSLPPSPFYFLSLFLPSPPASPPPSPSLLPNLFLSFSPYPSSPPSSLSSLPFPPSLPLSYFLSLLLSLSLSSISLCLASSSLLFWACLSSILSCLDSWRSFSLAKTKEQRQNPSQNTREIKYRRKKRQNHPFTDCFVSLSVSC